MNAQAAAAVLGLGEGEVGWSLSFRQLGGDSLAAARFAQRLEQLTGAAVPVSALLDHSHTLAAVAAQVAPWMQMLALFHSVVAVTLTGHLYYINLDHSAHQQGGLLGLHLIPQVIQAGQPCSRWPGTAHLLCAWLHPACTPLLQ